MSLCVVDAFFLNPLTLFIQSINPKRGNFSLKVELLGLWLS